MELGVGVEGQVVVEPEVQLALNGRRFDASLWGGLGVRVRGRVRATGPIAPSEA